MTRAPPRGSTLPTARAGSRRRSSSSQPGPYQPARHGRCTSPSEPDSRQSNSSSRPLAFRGGDRSNLLFKSWPMFCLCCIFVTPTRSCRSLIFTSRAQPPAPSPPTSRSSTARSRPRSSMRPGTRTAATCPIRRLGVTHVRQPREHFGPSFRDV